MTARIGSRFVASLTQVGSPAVACGATVAQLPGSTGGQQASVPGHRVARGVPPPGDTWRWPG